MRTSPCYSLCALANQMTVPRLGWTQKYRCFCLWNVATRDDEDMHRRQAEQLDRCDSWAQEVRGRALRCLCTPTPFSPRHPKRFWGQSPQSNFSTGYIYIYRPFASSSKLAAVLSTSLKYRLVDKTKRSQPCLSSISFAMRVHHGGRSDEEG